ncbi:hypothetical protein UFOVP5_13 [uncultured Caudovirales phage]|uniref:Uncharacterized protein n=1 Tax=uncultured Caudovirales phage TaxID=2100421 RepID=A0A6J5KHU8_9CAUD|nr:hypothetical protein UFOVP5_13 [uncultured Caudovirales phage]
MAASNPDLTLSETWQDLTATYAGMISVSSFVQCKGGYPCLIYWGGGSAPAGSAGAVLTSGNTAYGTAAKIWVRAVSGSAVIACGTTD